MQAGRCHAKQTTVMDRIGRSWHNIMRRTLSACPVHVAPQFAGNSPASAQLSSPYSATVALQAGSRESLSTAAGLLPTPAAAQPAALRHLQSSGTLGAVGSGAPDPVPTADRAARDSQSWPRSQSWPAAAAGNVSRAQRHLQQAPPLLARQDRWGRQRLPPGGPPASGSAAWRPRPGQHSGSANRQTEPRDDRIPASTHRGTEREAHGSERASISAASPGPLAPVAAAAGREGQPAPNGVSDAAAQGWQRKAAVEVAASEEDPSAAPESLVRPRQFD